MNYNSVCFFLKEYSLSHSERYLLFLRTVVDSRQYMNIACLNVQSNLKQCIMWFGQTRWCHHDCSMIHSFWLMVSSHSPHKLLRMPISSQTPKSRVNTSISNNRFLTMSTHKMETRSRVKEKEPVVIVINSDDKDDSKPAATQNTVSLFNPPKRSPSNKVNGLNGQAMCSDRDLAEYLQRQEDDKLSASLLLVASPRTELRNMTTSSYEPWEQKILPVFLF